MIKYKLWDKTFSQNSELEIHIKSECECTAVFPCEVFNKTFLLKLRLDNGHAQEEP